MYDERLNYRQNLICSDERSHNSIAEVPSIYEFAGVRILQFDYPDHEISSLYVNVLLILMTRPSREDCGYIAVTSMFVSAVLIFHHRRFRYWALG
jgi:hypothetical protein